MSVTVLNTTASLSGKTLLKAEDSQTVTGLKTFDLGAAAPFAVVAGAAKVTNLDADKLDGQTGVDYHDASLLTGIVPAASLSLANLWSVLAVEQVYASTGAQADVAPSAGDLVVILCTGAAPVISGFSGGVAGRRLRLVCKGTTLQVTNQGGGSAVANRIICASTQGQIVGVNGIIELVYDATNSRWLAALVSPGTPIAFTPTWTSDGVAPAIGNGVLSGKYVQRGKTCYVTFRFTAGGTTTFGTGTYFWALPLTAADADAIRLSGEILDSGTAFWAAWSRASSAGTTTGTITVGSSGSTSSTTAQTVPMTWANGDQLVLGGEYETT